MLRNTAGQEILGCLFQLDLGPSEERVVVGLLGDRLGEEAPTMRDALNKSTQGPIFSGWYASESKFNLNNLQNLVNVVVGQYPSRPFFQTPSSASNSLVLAGAGGAGNGVYYLLSATNLALPFTNWTVIVTNNFDVSGGFSVTVPLSTSNQERFYVIKLP